LLRSARYHLTEKPPHTVTSLDSLKENTIIERIGTYRNANPKTSALSKKIERLWFITAPLQRSPAPACAERSRSAPRAAATKRWRPHLQPASCDWRSTHPIARGRS